MGIAFDGANIWVANNSASLSGPLGTGTTVTKLLASNGTLLGTFTVGLGPTNIAFDGTSVWVTSFNYLGSVAKLQVSTGAILGTFNAGLNPDGIAFDGVNMWVTDYGNAEVFKL
jgi:hypothetical protein